VDVDELLFETEERMEKTASMFADELRTVRTSRASPALVETIRVDYYGSPTPIRQLAAISTPDPQLIVIKAFDPSSIGAIEKAIQKADIGLNPVSDRNLVRVPVPPLSEERRKQLAGTIKKMGEEAKVALRNIRREANKELDRAAKDSSSSLSEDDRDRGKKRVQELITTYEEKINSAYEKRSSEILGT